MEKVIVLIDNEPVITTLATAEKNRWYITHSVEAVKTEIKHSSILPNYTEPEPGIKLMGIGGHVYEILSAKPCHQCFACGEKGENRIGRKFYCTAHFKGLVTTRPIIRKEDKKQRNEKCACGSGKKFKHCCGANTHKPRHYFNSKYKMDEMNLKTRQS